MENPCYIVPKGSQTKSIMLFGGHVLECKDPDHVLVRRVKNRDISAFEEIVKRYQKAVFNMSYQMVGNYALAEDIAQETFLRAFRALSEYRPRAKFSTWLFKIAKNICFDELRRTSKHPMVSYNDSLLEMESRASISDTIITTPEDVVQSSELADRIAGIVSEFPPEYKMVILLRDKHSFSYREIAQIMSCPMGTVMSRLNRAHAILRKKLKEYISI